MNLEPVIGLEVHAQLATQSKIFCGCSSSFGALANSHACPVCLGLPGALPVLNRRSVELALRLIVATEGRIQETSLFARKNYFYPDLPKGFQISQFERPIGTGGVLRFECLGRKSRIAIDRIHLEEDAGKSMHQAGASLVDINRCGVPLVEIVTEPGLHSPEAASACLQSLRQLLRYLEICDGNMEEGSLRCDANVSVRPEGSVQLGTKTELKNMNSFRAVERAVRFEIDRQMNLLSHGGRVERQTLLWDENTGRAQMMRGKEESLDYRYFPEPDLVPLRVDEEWQKQVRRTLPELPQAREERLAREYGLPDYDARVLTADRALADYFERTAAACDSPKAASNWIMGEVLRYLSERHQEISGFGVLPESLGELIRAIERGDVSGKAAKDVLRHMLESGARAPEAIAALGLAQVSEEGDLASIVEQILQQETEQVAAFRAGKTKVLGYLMGQVMRATRGTANPHTAEALLRRRLEDPVATHIAVLVSGSGSNLAALLAAEQRGELGAHIELVVSNKPDAFALERARQAGRPAVSLSPSDFESEDAYAQSLLELLAAHRIEMICLAGYLKKVPTSVLAAFPGKVLNIHPAPLPGFGGAGMYGLRVHRAVLAAGLRQSGPTVHFVDAGYDTGPVAAHAPVPVLEGDTPEALAARVLEAEHRLYPRVVAAVATGRIRLVAGRVVGALDDP
jgi:aspartyl-tRNA(Asn)/glutamyl-tRNA(Gln) amidotransferase subunit B